MCLEAVFLKSSHILVDPQNLICEICYREITLRIFSPTIQYNDSEFEVSIRYYVIWVIFIFKNFWCFSYDQFFYSTSMYDIFHVQICSYMHVRKYSETMVMYSYIICTYFILRGHLHRAINCYNRYHVLTIHACIHG